MATQRDPFGARASLAATSGSFTIYRLDALGAPSATPMEQLPVTVRILLENLLRYCGVAGAGGASLVSEDDVLALARWQPNTTEMNEFAFMPARVLLQDFTGVPCVVDLASMRDAMRALGSDPRRINPLVPADLVIDHSVQVDLFGSNDAFTGNVAREYERNSERYILLRWAQQAFENFHVVPPGTGIVHQVNLEYLARVVQVREIDGEQAVFPDTLVGTDSHTTMVNGLGVLGWGVGGIEAEAVLLGQPLYQLTPTVIGMRLTGALPKGATATDLVLTVTQMLRKHGVVNKFVEFAGPGLSSLSLPDRATISNMSPEFGATATLFPVDAETLRYLRITGRDDDLIDLVERYTKEQGLFRTDNTPDPHFDEKLELDLSTVEPSLAGPRRPQDRVALNGVKQNFRSAYADRLHVDADGNKVQAHVTMPDSEETELEDGAVAIAAITSCTNTSNPSVMIGAGLLAKHAVERGLKTKPYVKTSLAPGSRVVTDYLNAAGLTPYLEALRFHTVGYGCTTCIGNSGPLPQSVSDTIRENDMVVAAVLSGNRNFEGRIHAEIRANYLASPPLVVAYALAGTVDIDLNADPLGHDANGAPVYLRDIWPSPDEVAEMLHNAVEAGQFKNEYGHVFDGDEHWQTLPVPVGDLFAWDETSTYVRNPPFFENLTMEPTPVTDIANARVLVSVGDSVTTDHISPAGNFKPDSPAGKYLLAHGVQPRDFNSYGSRRGNHEVMMRGTFGNIRLKNALVDGKEGYWTRHLPDGAEMTIYDAAMQYQQEGRPLIVLAGKEYGTGSSRDWAAKGPLLLGVRAVIAETYERIHRSNLVGMGVLPLQYREGENRETLGLTGRETFTITGIAEELTLHKLVTVQATRDDGSTVEFQAIARLDSSIDIEYYKHGGVLPYVLRRLAQ
jgi:aconitate hydratase